MSFSRSESTMRSSILPLICVGNVTFNLKLNWVKIDCIKLMFCVWFWLALKSPTINILIENFCKSINWYVNSWINSLRLPEGNLYKRNKMNGSVSFLKIQARPSMEGRIWMVFCRVHAQKFYVFSSNWNPITQCHVQCR